MIALRRYLRVTHGIDSSCVISAGLAAAHLSRSVWQRLL